MNLNFLMNRWGSKHFITIPAGQTLETAVDLSTTHELSSGGNYQVAVRSIIHYAQHDSYDVAGSIPYQTNTLSLNIPKHIARSCAPWSKLQKRARLYPDCSVQQLPNLTRASYLGAAWAGAGAVEALKVDSPTQVPPLPLSPDRQRLIVGFPD